MQNLKNRIIWIELLKVIAAIMITNSHYKLLYPENLSALGTFGAPGNALFFFISGYTLMLGKQNKFSLWYLKRLKRVWIVPFIYASIFAPIVYNESITLEKLWLAGDYWFIKCICIYYILYYFICKKGYIKFFMCLSFVFSVIYFLFIQDITPYSIYINDFHYICFFSFMLMGAYLSKKEIYNNNVTLNILYILLSIMLFYLLQYIGKGKTDFFYYIQIISLIPLHTFILFLFRIVQNEKIIKMISSNKIIYKTIHLISALTLEIYIVGFYFIYMTQFNNLFPLNLIIVSLILLCFAYILRIVSNLFLQFITNDKIEIKECFKI